MMIAQHFLCLSSSHFKQKFSRLSGEIALFGRAAAIWNMQTCLKTKCAQNHPIIMSWKLFSKEIAGMMVSCDITPLISFNVD